MDKEYSLTMYICTFDFLKNVWFLLSIWNLSTRQMLSRALKKVLGLYVCVDVMLAVVLYFQWCHIFSDVIIKVISYFSHIQLVSHLSCWLTDHSRAEFKCGIIWRQTQNIEKKIISEQPRVTVNIKGDVYAPTHDNCCFELFCCFVSCIFCSRNLATFIHCPGQ